MRTGIFTQQELNEPHRVPSKRKTLIIGHGRHGKDTVAEILRDYHGISFRSSSHWAAEHVVYPQFHAQFDSWQGCFKNRHDHRALWFDTIRQYCVDKGADAIAKGVLAESAVYVGMRSRLEFEGSMHLFDNIVWVDRSGHLPPESPDSMQLTASDAHVSIDNNGTLRDLWLELDTLVKMGYIHG